MTSWVLSFEFCEWARDAFSVRLPFLYLRSLWHCEEKGLFIYFHSCSPAFPFTYVKTLTFSLNGNHGPRLWHWAEAQAAFGRAGWLLPLAGSVHPRSPQARAQCLASWNGIWIWLLARKGKNRRTVSCFVCGLDGGDVGFSAPWGTKKLGWHSISS